MHHPGRIRSDRWYAVALLCREPRTIPALAKEMGVPAGSIRSLIESMRRENLLEEADSDARGVALKLTRHGGDELQKAQGAEDVQRLMPNGTRLVFVTEDGHGLAAEALAKLASQPNFRWAARVDGPVKWVASFGSGDGVAADQAANTLVAAGARAVTGLADAVYDSSQLADYAARLAHDSSPAAIAAESDG